MSPTGLVDALAKWLDRRVEELAARDGSAAAAEPWGRVFGFDGPDELGTAELADRVAETVRRQGRPVIRASTRRWWRPSALRLELGRQDVGMLLTGWVDSAALRRELIDPVVVGGLPYITELRNPETDRSVRQRPLRAGPRTVLLLDGPFLLAADLPLDGVVGLRVGASTLERALPPDKAWWTAAFERYRQDYRPIERADVVLAYDHPGAPAASGLAADRGPEADPP
jgi:hypothetical protein